MCEGVREELRGKLTILGFFGITPHVDVRVQHMDRPTGLCFVALGGKGDGKFMASYTTIAIPYTIKIPSIPFNHWKVADDSVFADFVVGVAAATVFFSITNILPHPEQDTLDN